MSKLSRTIEQMERLDKLIKRGATGTPNELAERLGVSRASLHRMLEIMKEMGAPIEYSMYRQSYMYQYQVAFYCGFYMDELQKQDAQRLNGGSTFYENLNGIYHFLGLVSKNETGRD